MSASAVSSTIFYIKATEDKNKNVLSFGSLAESASPKSSGGGFGE